MSSRAPTMKHKMSYLQSIGPLTRMNSREDMVMAKFGGLINHRSMIKGFRRIRQFMSSYLLPIRRRMIFQSLAVCVLSTFNLSRSLLGLIVILVNIFFIGNAYYLG